MTLWRRQLAILGMGVALLHLCAFFAAVQLLSSHGASMQAMIAKMDQIEYMQLADTMLSAHRFALSPDAAPEIFRTPGYPSLIAVAYVLTAHWYWSIFVVQALFTGAIAVLTSLLALALGLSRRTCLIAGGIIGISSGPLLLTMTATGSDVLYTFLYTVAVYLAIKNSGSRYAALIGVILGLATLVRPIGVLSSLPVLFGFGLLITGTTWQRYLRTTAIAGIGFAIVLTPWYVRNAIVAGTPVLSTVSTFNMTYYNIPMNEAFWTHGDEAAIRTAFVARTGTTSTDALRGAAYLPTMREIDASYLATHVPQYAIFHAFRTAPFFFASGYNVINAVLRHEVPSLYSPFFPSESENLTLYLSSHQWTAALRALGSFWFVTLERLIWLMAILAAFASPFFASGTTRRILLLFAVVIAMNAILVSPVTQARYRVPAEPFIWVAAIYTITTVRTRRENA